MSKKFQRFLSLVTALIMALYSVPVSAFASETVDVQVVSEEVHTCEFALTSENAPTCTEAGSKTYACSCGNGYSEEISAIGHSYSETVTAPTCTADGSRVKTCSTCSDTVTETISATGHSYSSAVTTEATCAQVGVITYTCSACNDSYTEEIPMIDHSYEKVTVEATCTEAGKITSTCTVCGATMEEVLSTVDHSYETVTVDATCTEAGKITKTCTVCGAVTEEEVAAAGHSYETVTVEATCTEAGKITSTCTVCNEVAEEEIPAAHSYETVTVEATCTEAGKITKTCTVCNEVVEEEIPALGHNFEEDLENSVEATCTEEGSLVKVCTLCGESETEAVEMAEHEYVDGFCVACGAPELMLLAKAEPVAMIGDQGYETLAAAFAAAKKGDTIELLMDVNVTEQIKVTDNDVLSDITLNGGSYMINAELDPENQSVLYFGDTSSSAWATGVKINDLTIVGTARFGIALMGGTSSQLTNVNIYGDYYYGINLYGTHGATMTNCDVVSVFTNGQDDYPLTLVNTAIGELYANKSDAVDGAKVFAQGNSTIGELTFWGESTVMLDSSALDCVESPIEGIVAKSNGVAYTSLQAALDATKANTNIVIDLLDDVTLDITAWQTLAIGGDATETITINGNDNKLTFNQLNSDWNNVATNNAKLILNNMTIANSGHNDGPWNRYDINFACDVELNNVISERALAFKAGATLKNVEITESKDVYAIWIQPNGQDVTIDGLTINSAGRGIKIDEQYVDNPEKVELSVTNAVFNTQNKAAIVVKSAAGADIKATNVDIANVAADSINLVWNDEDAAAEYGDITVTGGMLAQEGDFAVAVLGVDGNAKGYYKTLQDALNVCTAGETIVLQSDITIDNSIGVADGIIIDLNDNTINLNVENSTFGDVTIKNGNIVIGKDDVHVCDGYTQVNAGKTLKLEGVTLTSSSEGYKGYTIFHLYKGANLVLNDSTIDVANNEYVGSIVYADNGEATTTVNNCSIIGENIGGAAFVHTTLVFNDSNVELVATTENGMEHGINRSAVSINDSTVTITGGWGRGITAENGDMEVTGNSVVTISDMDGASVELRGNKNLTVTDPAVVYIDVPVNNTTSGKVTGTVIVTKPYGSITPGYTREGAVWGEGGGNAKESLVVELYVEDAKIASTSLNNVDNIIDGDVYVTWSMPFDGITDNCWTVEWAEGYPNADAQPTKVVLYIDGVKVAENEVQMNAPDNVAPVVWKDLEYFQADVAKVGDKAYKTVAKAVAAAQSGDTVTLIADTTRIEKVEIPERMTLTLDLAGYTMNGSMLAPNANLTVQNGSIVNNDVTVSALEINAGELHLVDVNIDSARHAIRIDGAVTATINGGTYRSAIGTGGGTYHAVNISGAANVTIVNGTFVGPKGTAADSGAAVNVQKDAQVTINGGKYSGGKNHTLSAAGTLVVTGGFFDQDPSAYVDANEYAVKKGSDGFYKVLRTPVAMVDSADYYSTIDEAVANWTEHTTLTLLADVTLSDVILLSSMESHTLDLSTFTMTAASGKNAIEITCDGRSSAGYALTVKADASNPGGITATDASCIYYNKADNTKDRPMIRILGGEFNGSYSINVKSDGNLTCPQLYINDGTFNGDVNVDMAKLSVKGGTFNGQFGFAGDSVATCQISAGTFKDWQGVTASEAGQIGVGISATNYNVGLYVDDNGYLVVGGSVITEAGNFEASTDATVWNEALKYSSAADNALFYTSVETAMAMDNATGVVTVYVDELEMTGSNYAGTIVMPEGTSVLVATFAESDTPAWTVESADEEKIVLYTDAVENGVVTRTYKAFVPVAQILDANGNVLGIYEDFEGALAAAVANADVTRLEVLRNYTQATITNLGDAYEIAEGQHLTIGSSAGNNFTVILTRNGNESLSIYQMNNDTSLTIDSNIAIEGLDIIANGFATSGNKTVIDGDVKLLSLKQWTSNNEIIVGETGSVWMGYGDGQLDLAYGNGSVTVNGTLESTADLTGVSPQFKAGYSGTRGNGNTLNLNNTYFDAGAWFNLNGSNGTINVDGSVLMVSGGDASGRLSVASTGNNVVLNDGSRLVVGNIELAAGNKITIDSTSKIEAKKITGAGAIVIDAVDMKAGDTVDVTGDLSGFTGTYEVINNNKLEASLVDGKIVLAGRKLIEVTYADGTVAYFTNMLDAVPYKTNYDPLEGATIKLLDNIEDGGIRMMENDMVLDLNGFTYTITAGAGSKNTETSVFQIRQEITTQATVKNGTIQIAEGVQIAWIFNVYAPKFIVENVTVDCTNMDWGYGQSCYAVVGQTKYHADNHVMFTGNTKIENFDSEVGGNAVYLGNTMTIADTAEAGGTIALDVGATLTAREGLVVVPDVEGYMVRYENGIYSIFLPVVTVSDAEGNVKGYYKTLPEAIAAAQDGETITIIADGTYTLNGFSYKALTIEAAEGINATIDLKNQKPAFHGSQLVLNGLNLEYANVDYHGLQHIDTVEYNDCTITGQPFLYGNSEVFNRCTFNQTSSNHYNVWTYGAKEVTFNDCTFNSAGKSVLVYNEGGPATHLVVNNTAFNASSPVSGKAAIEINTIAPDKPGAMDGTTIEINNTTATGFANGSVSGNPLWNDKMTLENLSVFVDDVQVWPIFVAKIDEQSYTSLTKAFEAAQTGDIIVVIDDIELDDAGLVVAADKSFTLDLNGKTVSQTKVCTTKHSMITNKGDLTIKDSVGEGKIVFTDNGAGDPNYGWGSYTITNSGTLTVDGGTIQNASTLTKHAGYTIQNTGILTVNDGKLLCDNNYVIRQFSSGSDNVVTINGGEITGIRPVWMQLAGSDTSVAPKMVLNINGGTLNSSPDSGNYKLAVYSYSYGNSMANTEINITGGTLNGDVALTGGKNKTAVETVNISDGTLTNVYSYGDDELAAEAITITGGVYESNEPEMYTLDNGYFFSQNAEGKYVIKKIPVLPTATVTELEKEDLTFALNFTADDATDDQLEYYGDWYADFVLTLNKDATFNANGGADGWLSGQYDAWPDGWVNVPFEDVTMTADESLKIMEYAAKMMGQPGLKLTYNDVYSVVKDFNCGVFFTNEYLKNNQDLVVTLELRMYNPAEESESYVIGETYTFTPEQLRADVNAVSNISAGGEGEKYRERFGIELHDVYARETLELKIYSGDKHIATTTYLDADRDDPNQVLVRPITGTKTVNVVVAGYPSGSWDTTWHFDPSVSYIPDKVMVYADGVLVDTETMNVFNDEEKAQYCALPGVAKAASVTDSEGNVTYYATIADAIKAADPGYEVFIYAGEYTGNVSINKDITVVGETDADGNYAVFIKGKVNVTGTGATVKNLSIFNGRGSGMYINGGDILVEHCEFTGANGMYQSYANGNVTLKDCVITGGTYGVHFDGSAGGNVIIEGGSVQGWTSFASTIGKVTITDVEFKDGSYDKLRFYQNAEVTNCTFPESMSIDFGVNNTTAEFNNITVAGGKELTDILYIPDIVDMGIKAYEDGVLIVVEATVTDSTGAVDYFLKLTDAVEAAQEGDLIKMHADVELTDPIALGNDVTLSLNGNKLTGNVVGKLAMAGGIYITGEGFKMVAPVGTDASEGFLYYSDNGVFNIVSLADITMEAGDVKLAQDWRTLPGQKVTVAEGASFTVPAGMKFEILGNATVNGTLTIEETGEVVLADASATLTAKEGLNVTTSVADHKVVYEDDMYKVVAMVYVAEVTNNGVTTKYESLQAALDACTEGDNTVTMLDNSDEDVTIKQEEGVNVTIDGAEKVYTGTITIHGSARHTGEETLTIKNVKFETDELKHYFIDSNSTGSVERYAHNVTVDNCTFTATDAAVHTAAAMRIRQGFDITVKNSKADNMHSVVQAYGNAGLTVDGLTVTNGKNGISAGTSTNAVVENSKFEVTGYGIRADGEGAFDLTVEDCTITADMPIVVRKNTGAYKLTVNGSNSFTASNEGGYQVIFTNGDDGVYVVPTGAYVYTPDEANSELVVYPDAAYVAQIGETKYMSLAEAIAAAEDGDTITVIAPIELTETVTVDKKVTLDLNGQEITADVDSLFGSIYVSKTGDLTVKDEIGEGKITNATGTAIGNYGTVTIEGGTIAAAEDSAALYNFNYQGELYGTSTIAGGTMESPVWNCGVMTITGGTLKDIDNSGKMDITGEEVLVMGTIIGQDGDDAPGVEGAGTLTITAGTYHSDPTEWVAEGYVAEDNGDGTWTVVEDKLFDIVSSNIVLGNELAMYFYVMKSDLEGEDYVAVVTKTYADGRSDLVVQIPYEDWENTTNERMRFRFDGIAAKEMGDNINVVIKVASTMEDASNPYNDCIKTYVERGFSSGKVTNQELGTLLVDMLNYGAAAQRMFNYNVDELANCNMDAYQEEYATKSVTCTNNQVKGDGYRSATLTLESRIIFTMLFNKTHVTQDMTAVVTFTDHYGASHELKISGADFEDRGAAWGIEISEHVVADACQILTCTFLDANGNIVEGVSGQDSIESLCARAIAGGGGDYYEYIMKFSIAAYNYFH